jgi:hypothetical protein
MALDPLDDCFSEMTRAGVEPAIATRVISALRSRWGGAQCYVRKGGAEREEAIRRGIEDGRPAAELASVVGVHVSTIRRRRSRWLD